MTHKPYETALLETDPGEPDSYVGTWEGRRVTVQTQGPSAMFWLEATPAEAPCGQVGCHIPRLGSLERWEGRAWVAGQRVAVTMGLVRTSGQPPVLAVAWEVVDEAAERLAELAPAAHAECVPETEAMARRVLDEMTPTAGEHARAAGL